MSEHLSKNNESSFGITDLNDKVSDNGFQADVVNSSGSSDSHLENDNNIKKDINKDVNNIERILNDIGEYNTTDIIKEIDGIKAVSDSGNSTQTVSKSTKTGLDNANGDDPSITLPESKIQTAEKIDLNTLKIKPIDTKSLVLKRDNLVPWERDNEIDVNKERNVNKVITNMIRNMWCNEGADPIQITDAYNVTNVKNIKDSSSIDAVDINSMNDKLDKIKENNAISKVKMDVLSKINYDSSPIDVDRSLFDKNYSIKKIEYTSNMLFVECSLKRGTKYDPDNILSSALIEYLIQNIQDFNAAIYETGFFERDTLTYDVLVLLYDMAVYKTKTSAERLSNDLICRINALGNKSNGIKAVKYHLKNNFDFFQLFCIIENETIINAKTKSDLYSPTLFIIQMADYIKVYNDYLLDSIEHDAQVFAMDRLIKEVNKVSKSYIEVYPSIKKLGNEVMALMNEIPNVVSLNSENDTNIINLIRILSNSIDSLIRNNNTNSNNITIVQSNISNVLTAFNHYKDNIKLGLIAINNSIKDLKTNLSDTRSLFGILANTDVNNLDATREGLHQIYSQLNTAFGNYGFNNSQYEVLENYKNYVMNNLNGIISKYNNVVDFYNSILNDLEKRLKDDLIEKGNSISSLQSQLSTLSTSLNALQTSGTGLSTTVNTLEKGLEDKNKKIIEINKMIEEIKTDIRNIKNDNATKEDVDGIKDENSKIKDRLDKIEKDIQSKFELQTRMEEERYEKLDNRLKMIKEDLDDMIMINELINPNYSQMINRLHEQKRVISNDMLARDESKMFVEKTNSDDKQMRDLRSIYFGLLPNENIINDIPMYYRKGITLNEYIRLVLERVDEIRIDESKEIYELKREELILLAKFKYLLESVLRIEKFKTVKSETIEMIKTADKEVTTKLTSGNKADFKRLENVIHAVENELMALKENKNSIHLTRMEGKIDEYQVEWVMFYSLFSYDDKRDTIQKNELKNKDENSIGDEKEDNGLITIELGEKTIMISFNDLVFNLQTITTSNKYPVFMKVLRTNECMSLFTKLANDIEDKNIKGIETKINLIIKKYIEEKNRLIERGILRERLEGLVKNEKVTKLNTRYNIVKDGN